MAQEKYVRTIGGAIWELGKDGNYHIPGCATLVKSDASYICDRADKVYELVHGGDLVVFQDDSGRIITEKDAEKGVDSIREELYLVKKIYTKYDVLDDYKLVAYKSNGYWILK